MLVHFYTSMILLQANRSILLQEDRVKAETERAKAPVDLTTLQLHNLMYEKSHYVKAIKACKDFKSKYPDIELVPEEEFLRDAPEDIKGQKLSSDISHDLMLKRLNYELYQVAGQFHRFFFFLFLWKLCTCFAKFYFFMTRILWDKRSGNTRWKLLNFGTHDSSNVRDAFLL